MLMKHGHHGPAVAFLFQLPLLSVTPSASVAQVQSPTRIIITNDDGIEEVEARLLPVANRLREFADVYIVVADQDRSGSSNFLSVNRRSSLESRLEYRAEATDDLHLLEVHSVIGGYPADCVILATYGILGQARPDLVISGPNGGANLADGWFGSGTIGAARTAAYLGIPALAISGLDSDESEQVATLAEWIAMLARSPAVRDMPELTYLTIGVPTIAPSLIQGVRMAPRDRRVVGFTVERVATLQDESDDDEITSVWTISADAADIPVEPGSDVALYQSGYIVVTPMRVDEHAMSTELARLVETLPGWPQR